MLGDEGKWLALKREVSSDNASQGHMSGGNKVIKPNAYR